MEGRFSLFVFVSLFVATMLHGSSAQTTHVVGNAMGWIIPQGGEVAYRTWAATQSFVVGNVLVFNFANGAHDVLQVTRAEFDSCSISTTTTPPITTSPARLTLTSAGEHYYICAVPQHCSFGQKLAINVTGGSSTAPPPSGTAPPPGSGGPTPTAPTPSPATTPPPLRNSAPSFAVAALPFTLLAVAALAFLYN